MPPTNVMAENELLEYKKFPYEIRDVDPKVNEKLLKDFTGERTGFVQVGPKKYFFPYKYRSSAEHIYNFKVRPDDIFIATFPRSGTTWTQEMVWLIANNLDFEGAAKIPLLLRFPFLEYSMFVHKDIKAELLEQNKSDPEKYEIVKNMDQPKWEVFDGMNERRFIKTHMPFSLLPQDLLQSGCKVIYVARHPKDVAVSFYHLNRLMKTQGYQNDFATYLEYFQDSYQAWTPYWEHVKEAWEVRNNPNLLFLFYENLNKDLRSSIKEVSNFLGKTLNEQQLDRLVEHLDIKNFRNNPSVNFDLLTQTGVGVKGEQAFIRLGKCGNWSSYDEELGRKMDKWIEENLKKTDMRFPEIKI